MRSSRKEVGDSATTGPKNMYCVFDRFPWQTTPHAVCERSVAHTQSIHKKPPSQRPDQPRTPQDLPEKGPDSHIAFEGRAAQSSLKATGLPRNAADAEKP